MHLSSSLTDFSLAELFQLIDQRKKSGCLTVCVLPELYALGAKTQDFYIWFKQGQVVAAANRLHGQSLMYKIVHRNWVNLQVIDEVFTEVPKATALGLHLKTQGLLTSEQLHLLFADQLKQIRKLFEIQNGVFKLNSEATLPWSEMTGLGLGAMEVALMALRALKNWTVLTDVLPDTGSAIQSMTRNKLQTRLNAFEWQVWESANGTTSLSAIASRLNQPKALVQQAAFRLIFAGLAVEVPLMTFSFNPNDCTMAWNSVNPSDSQAQNFRQPEILKISTSFLQNLVGFLKSKA